jgi:hypothetical protein
MLLELCKYRHTQVPTVYRGHKALIVHTAVEDLSVVEALTTRCQPKTKSPSICQKLFRQN